MKKWPSLKSTEDWYITWHWRNYQRFSREAFPEKYFPEEQCWLFSHLAFVSCKFSTTPNKVKGAWFVSLHVILSLLSADDILQSWKLDMYECDPIHQFQYTRCEKAHFKIVLFHFKIVLFHFAICMHSWCAKLGFGSRACLVVFGNVKCISANKPEQPFQIVEIHEIVLNFEGKRYPGRLDLIVDFNHYHKPSLPVAPPSWYQICTKRSPNYLNPFF